MASPPPSSVGSGRPRHLLSDSLLEAITGTRIDSLASSFARRQNMALVPYSPTLAEQQLAQYGGMPLTPYQQHLAAYWASGHGPPHPRHFVPYPVPYPVPLHQGPPHAPAAAGQPVHIPPPPPPLEDEHPAPFDETGDTVELIPLHVCAVCGNPRSRGYHRVHPLVVGEDRPTDKCGRCVKKEKKAELSRLKNEEKIRRANLEDTDSSSTSLRKEKQSNNTDKNVSIVIHNHISEGKEKEKPKRTKVTVIRGGRDRSSSSYDSFHVTRTRTETLEEEVTGPFGRPKTKKTVTTTTEHEDHPPRKTKHSRKHEDPSKYQKEHHHPEDDGHHGHSEEIVIRRAEESPAPRRSNRHKGRPTKVVYTRAPSHEDEETRIKYVDHNPRSQNRDKLRIIKTESVPGPVDRSARRAYHSARHHDQPPHVVKDSDRRRGRKASPSRTTRVVVAHEDRPGEAPPESVKVHEFSPSVHQGNFHFQPHAENLFAAGREGRLPAGARHIWPEHYHNPSRSRPVRTLSESLSPDRNPAHRARSRLSANTGSTVAEAEHRNQRSKQERHEKRNRPVRLPVARAYSYEEYVNHHNRPASPPESAMFGAVIPEDAHRGAASGSAAQIPPPPPSPEIRYIPTFVECDHEDRHVKWQDEVRPRSRITIDRSRSSGRSNGRSWSRERFEFDHDSSSERGQDRGRSRTPRRQRSPPA